MTADVELLPCPFCGEGENLLVERLEGTILHPAHRIRCDNCGASTGYTDRDSRANWNTRATAAKDAEIEALRAEVAAVWNAMPSGTRYLDPPDGGDVPLHEQVRRMAADAARAERLAEALREKADKWDRIGDEHGVRQFTGNDHKLFANELRAALRDHDQEEK